MADINKLNKMMPYMTQIPSDMFRALQTLRQKQVKYTQFKQRMIQELLTGRTRLGMMEDKVE